MLTNNYVSTRQPIEILSIAFVKSIFCVCPFRHTYITQYSVSEMSFAFIRLLNSFYDTFQDDICTRVCCHSLLQFIYIISVASFYGWPKKSDKLFIILDIEYLLNASDRMALTAPINFCDLQMRSDFDAIVRKCKHSNNYGVKCGIHVVYTKYINLQHIKTFNPSIHSFIHLSIHIE